MKSTVSRTTCPFCTLGCEISVGNDRMRFWNEYPETGFNKGRVCPRGSLAARLLNYETRLAYPIRENHEISWSEAIADIRNVLSKFKAEELAITYDKNLTVEEFELIGAFAQALGVSAFASSYLEPEHCFNRVDETARMASPEEITQAEVILLVGDVFSQSPVIAKFVLDARYKHRDRRIITMDSLSSYTLGFGDVQLLVEPGTEPFALAAVITAGLEQRKDMKDFCSQAGVDEASIIAAANLLARLKKGVIISVMSAGKTVHPMAQALLPLLLPAGPEGGMKYVPLAESFSFPGTVDFGKLLPRIKAREIKAVLNFGDFFPFFYPQLAPDLADLQFMLTTSTLRPPRWSLPMLTLPVASNLEKSGTIVTTFGVKPISPMAEPVSGARTVTAVLESLAKACGIDMPSALNKKRRPKPAKESQQEAVSLDEILKSLPARRKSGHDTVLIGEKAAFDFLGILGEPSLKISPAAAKESAVHTGEQVMVKADGESIKVKAEISAKVKGNQASISAELPHIRALFPMAFHARDGGPAISPAGVKIWKEE